MRMLENEGFAWEKYVDIFDGGPTMTARTDQIASIRNSVTAEVTGVLDLPAEGAEARLIATGRLAEFRAAYGNVTTHGDGVAIDRVTAELLGVEPGMTITHVGR